MAYDGAKQSLVPITIDPDPTLQENGTKRRYRRCRGVSTDFSHLRKNKDGMHRPSISTSAKLHPSIRKVVILLAFYLGGGTLCFYLVEDQIKGKKTNGIVDAMYFCIVTMTTLGYGDLIPDSVATKLFACSIVLIGMVLVGLVLSKAADYLVEKQETLLIEALHIHENVGGTEILKKIKTNKVKCKFFMILAFLLALITVGTIVLATVENMGLLDSFYCVCCTITSLGYGDKSFSTKAGRLFAVFWILISTISLALCLLYLAELSTEHRQKSLVKWILKRRMTCIDLEEADIDDDGAVCAAEFVIYKLKEIGKISEEDISLVMENFDDQDVDKSQTLTKLDIMPSRSSQP